MSEPELKPCKRCGHTPLEMFGIGQRRYFCVHCCHEFEATVSAPWRPSKAEAIAAWNEMQLQTPVEPEEKKSEEAEIVGLYIEQVLDKTLAMASVCQSAKQRCGQSHLVAAFDYLISEAAEIKHRLYEIKREIEKRSKND